MQKTSNYLQFWGKAGGAQLGEPAWHPAAYHNLDVAAVANELLDNNPRKLAQMARLLQTSPESARCILVALIALHDVGKFAEAFQCKVPDAWPTGVLGPWRPSIGPRHDQTGFDLREKLDLFTLLGPSFDDAWRPTHVAMLWGAVAGHHGKPVDINGSLDNPDGIRRAGIDAARAFARDVVAAFGPFEGLPKPDPAKLAALSWSVAGLTVVADWIGSNRDYFAYRNPELTLAEYWTQAQALAGMAVKAAGIGPAPVAADVSVDVLFPSIANPSPLQTCAATVEQPAGPYLTIIEDVTGSGKTEAALLLAARMIEAKRADGLFFALPTMATANAMFDRLGESYRRIFDAATSPSLVLAHGRRSLHKGFQASILEASIPQVSEREAEKTGNEANAVCSAWVADDRRKAFLAHVGVGTIDQAFLGALPSKYQALRLWGLSDRVLIVDEAHAYDAYMGRELERLLEFHAALGGSVIILSATLPAAQRTALGNAFARGLGKVGQTNQTSAYPLVTVVSADGMRSNPVATREDRTRRLPVRQIDSCDDAIQHVLGTAGRGAAVAWIRNSVDDAIETVEQLRARDLDPILLHARFAMGDRLAIEERVRTTLGKTGDPAKRHGLVLIGTQILEQSLDYDVDAMITDLAPIDLMIQRAGRLWRHTERTGRPIMTPELLVLAPDWKAVEDKNWYRQISPRAAAVYGHHGLVWRSAKTLFEAGAIETPGAVRALIESVYGVDGLDDIPSALMRASQEAEGKRSAARSVAGANLLKVEDGYGGDTTIWTSDTITPTRLGDPVTIFRLGRLEAGQIVPWCECDDGDLRRAWALSEVSLSQRKATSLPEGKGAIVDLVGRAKEAWPEWEREQPLLLLEPDGRVWRGVVTDRSGVALAVLYDNVTGLRIVSSA